MFTYENGSLDNVLAELQDALNVYRVNVNSGDSDVTVYTCGENANCVNQTAVNRNTALICAIPVAGIAAGWQNQQIQILKSIQLYRQLDWGCRICGDDTQSHRFRWLLLWKRFKCYQVNFK